MEPELQFEQAVEWNTHVTCHIKLGCRAQANIDAIEEVFQGHVAHQQMQIYLLSVRCDNNFIRKIKYTGPSTLNSVGTQYTHNEITSTINQSQSGSVCEETGRTLATGKRKNSAQA